MNELQYATLAYAACLIILFVCILFIRVAVGVLPGFVGVIFGIYVQFVLSNPSGLAIMSGGLLLEIGSVQLLYILKKYEQGSHVKSEPVNQ